MPSTTPKRALKSTAEAPRQITLLGWSTDGTKIYGLGRNMHVFDATGTQIEEKNIDGWEAETYGQPDVLAAWSQFEVADVMASLFYAPRLDLPADDPTAFRTGMLTQDLETGEMKMQEIEIADIFYFSGVVSPDKKRAYGVYNFLSSFDLDEAKAIKRVTLPHSYYSVNVATDGKTIYISGALNDVAAYDAETLERKAELKLPDGSTPALSSVRLFTRDE